MSELPIATYVVWIIPVAAQVCLVKLMLRRKLIRELPLFCSYAAYQAVSASALFIIHKEFGSVGSVTYFYAYAAVEAISLILGILVISEVFGQIFKDYEALQRLGTLLLRWAIVVLVLLAVLSAAAAPGQYENQAMRALVLMERSVRIIQAGLLLLLFLFTSYFGISWKNYVLGIALGFGIFGSVQLAITALHNVGAVSFHVFHLSSGIAETLACLIWTAYMIAPEKRKTVDEVPQYNLDEWNRALLGLINR
jgi:hypothetical protein